ncbi:ribose 5-phosphate isomerase B [Salibacterium halotolerans]|uniref:Ribose 5-phosphate isomerase B n=1 Tax=Salibacterium halotolerans TaxID=1884432 RepID=A0A1I5PLN8_9BACI|nr:ribose 5-phosphate isomerase B [Salibacterium halotolerans]SFP35042.1 ribose 5-phosphate isomerase B [Salibacterium halotolerans]
MKIAVGSDHMAYELKEIVKYHINQLGHEAVDYGCYNCTEVDYPDVAFEAAQGVKDNQAERGILICGTGIGVSISACKVPGIRAALCHDVYSAERAQLSNNAQILTMGAQVIGPEPAKKIVEAYLNVTFQGGNSERKVNKIIEKEKEFMEVHNN